MSNAMSVIGVLLGDVEPQPDIGFIRKRRGLRMNKTLELFIW